MFIQIQDLFVMDDKQLNKVGHHMKLLYSNPVFARSFAPFLVKIFISWTNLTVGNTRSGPVSRKPRKFFGLEKPFVKLQPAYSVKLVFS